MTCSEIREALSARYDGERSPLDPAAVRAHVRGCAECAAFERGLAALEVHAGPAHDAVPDLTASVLSDARRYRRRGPVLLRVAVALSAVLELAMTGADFVRETRLGDGSHESHESVAMTVGLCVALLAAAMRPRLAAGYLPVLGVATLLLVTSSLIDIHDREVTWRHETEHTGLVLGFLLLCLLAGADRARPWALLSRRRTATETYRPPLRAVSRVGVALRTLRVSVAAVLAAALVLVAGPAHAAHDGGTTGQGGSR